MPRLVEFIFPQAIFSIDSLAGACYNRAGSADNPTEMLRQNFSTFFQACQAKKICAFVFICIDSAVVSCYI